MASKVLGLTQLQKLSRKNKIHTNGSWPLFVQPKQGCTPYHPEDYPICSGMIKNSSKMSFEKRSGLVNLLLVDDRIPAGAKLY